MGNFSFKNLFDKEHDLIPFCIFAALSFIMSSIDPLFILPVLLLSYIGTTYAYLCLKHQNVKLFDNQFMTTLKRMFIANVLVGLGIFIAVLFIGLFAVILPKDLIIIAIILSIIFIPFLLYVAIRLAFATMHSAFTNKTIKVKDAILDSIYLTKSKQFVIGFIVVGQSLLIAPMITKMQIQQVIAYNPGMNLITSLFVAFIAGVTSIMLYYTYDDVIKNNRVSEKEHH